MSSHAYPISLITSSCKVDRLLLNVEHSLPFSSLSVGIGHRLLLDVSVLSLPKFLVSLQHTSQDGTKVSDISKSITFVKLHFSFMDGPLKNNLKFK